MENTKSWFEEDRLWAKKSEENSGFKWLPLSQHLEDTKNIAGLLWEHWLSPGQKLFILESLNYDDEYDGKRFVQFLAAIHDLGKATPVFQKQKSYINSYDLDEYLVERLEGTGLFGLAEHTFPDAKKTPHALAGQTLLKSYGVNDDIAVIIGSHHGKPTNDIRYFETQQSYGSNYRQEENIEHPVNKKWCEIQQKILSWALSEAEYESIEELPTVSQTGQVLLSGVLIMADWIASNEKFFPLVDVNTEEVIDQNERVRKGWSSWFKTGVKAPENTVEIEKLYQKRFGKNFEPRDAQRVLFETIDRCLDPGIFVFEAPMGLGKTEAALIGAEQLAVQLGRSGVFFALPTQATSNSMFSRVNQWIQNLDFEFGDKASMQLVHGKAALNEEFSNLPRASQINIDENEDIAENTVQVNQWFSGRKTSILDDFVVGTVDHILLAALKQKHLMLRHLGLSRKVVIIDEIHAYDSYMSVYLERALAWLGCYHVPVILLSATLPAEQRINLVKAYLRGRGIKSRDMEIAKDIETTAYPLVTYSDGNKILQERDFPPMPDVEVKVKPLDEAQLFTIIDDIMEKEGIIGIIVNTVKRAQEIAKQCIDRYGEAFVYLLHSNFIATERIKKENELLSMIGKGAERPKKKIIIGTQVIEQSLDIDFDLLISDLAPIDLLIQRIGRLHRHEIKRPESLKNPLLYVLGLNEELDFENGSVAVYGGYLLARTQYFLPESIHLPGDISPLVQKVYGKEQIILDSNLEVKYKEMEKEFQMKRKSKKDRAKTFLLGEPKHSSRRHKPNSLIKWLDIEHPDQSEEHGYAQVRDIEETIEVIALQKHGDGYGFIGESEDISEQIDCSKMAGKMAASTLRLPLAFSKKHNIDKTIKALERYNRENLNDWQRQSWLKGSLGIVFDEQFNFKIGDKVLHYDPTYGLTYEKEGIDE